MNRKLDFLITSGGLVFYSLMSFLVNFMLAKYLPTSEFGKFQLLVTFVGIFSLISTLGIGEGFVYFVQKLTGKRKYTFIIYNYLYLAVVTLISIFLIRWNVNFIDTIVLPKIDLENELLFYFPSLFLAYNFFVISVNILRGLQMFVFRSIMLYFISPLAFIIGIILLNYDQDLSLKTIFGIRSYIYGTLAIVMMVYIGIKQQRYFNWNKHFFKFIKEYHIFSLSVFVIGVIKYMAEQPIIDLVILANLSSEVDVGKYALNYRLASLILLIYAAFNVVYTPKLIALKKKSISSFIVETKKLRQQMLILCVFLTIVAAFTYDPLMPLLFPAEYGQMKEVFILLCLGFSLACYGAISSIILLIIGRKKIEIYISIGTILTLLIGGFFLTQALGPIGLAIANVFAFLVSTTVRNFITNKYLIRLQTNH